MIEEATSQDPAPSMRWAKVVDHTRCIGCHACSTACKSENEVPLGVNRTYVKYAEVGFFPEVKRSFQVTRCNQCDDAPCVTACPTSAMFRRPDGIVDFDKSACIGCKACMAACPYDAIFINPQDHSAEKCNFCAHRLDVGLEPACVVVCPTEAILVGNLNDPSSKVAKIVHKESVAVRKPEKDTQPKLFYKGVHQATLDPLAARRPAGGLFMWSEQQPGAGKLVAGHPDTGRRAAANSSAAALLAYDVPHGIPWDWRVSLYTLTKGISAGVYLVLALAVLLGLLSATSPLWRWAAPVVGGAFLALTGLVLISDLEHPGRFWMIFTRPQWKSWLVRGSFIIAAYGAVLALHFGASLAGRTDLLRPLAFVGVPLAVMTAVYTAYLFAQAKARDLWQNALLPPHLAVQALMAGCAALLPLALWLEPRRVGALALGLALASGVHLLMALGEATMPHATAHARLAAHEMVRGRYRVWFRSGMALAALAVVAPWVAAPLAVVAAVAGLAGLLAFEHAFVQAGQSVPLA